MKRETSISRRSLLVGTACAALGALTGCTAPEPTAEEPQPELILRYAENQPEDYPTTKAALAFAEMVAQRTNGRVKVVVYSGGELGGELSVIEQMQFGGIDFARVSLSQLAGLLENLSVLQLPYLYEDAKQMWRVLDGSIGDGFLSTLENVDLVGLSWFDAGVRSFYTREKAATLADLQGKVIRVQESDMMSEMVSDMGAVPVQVVYSQVYAALHNGRIDGAENNWPSYEAMGHYEVAPYFLKNEHTRVPGDSDRQPAALEKLAGWTARSRASSGAAPGQRQCGAPPLGRAGSSGRRRYEGLGCGSDHPFRGRDAEIPGGGPARCMSGLPNRQELIRQIQEA